LAEATISSNTTGDVTVKVLLFEVPPGLTTETFTAPGAIAGTTAVMVVLELVTGVTLVELNLTVELFRFVPVRVIVVPGFPDVGLMAEIKGVT
jgi:hypothetical protein